MLIVVLQRQSLMRAPASSLALALAVLGAVLIGTLQPACVSAVSYSAAANGLWESASTWSPAGVPSTSDDVLIGSNWIVNCSVSHTITSIQLSTGPRGALLITGGAVLTVSNCLYVSGASTINGTGYVCVCVSALCVVCAVLCQPFDWLILSVCSVFLPPSAPSAPLPPPPPLSPPPHTRHAVPWFRVIQALRRVAEAQRKRCGPPAPQRL